MDERHDFGETDYSMQVQNEPDGKLKTFNLNLKEFDPVGDEGRTMVKWR